MTQILTDDQIRRCQEICRTNADSKIVPELKTYLNQHQPQLLAKGILPDYMAWMIYGHHAGILK